MTPLRLCAFALKFFNPRSFLVIPLALLIDLALGDPANRWHPVAWMGTAIAWTRRHAPRREPARQFFYGLSVVTAGALGCAAVGRALSKALGCLPTPLAIVAEAVALKMALSPRGLLAAGEAVRGPLATGDLDAARQQLSWHLVSRDTSALDEAQIAAATVESLAENLADGVIAPLFWYAAAGLPGALAHRFLNTADAMLGYRDAEREWLGKTSARLDDAVNFVPARLTALLIVAAAPLVGGSGRAAWHIWRRDAGLTDSPNAGHPMSAAAGALDVTLEKVGHYTLGAGLRPPCAADIRSAQQMIAVAALLAAGLFAAAGRVHRA